MKITINDTIGQGYADFTQTAEDAIQAHIENTVRERVSERDFWCGAEADLDGDWEEFDQGWVTAMSADEIGAALEIEIVAGDDDDRDTIHSALGSLAGEIALEHFKGVLRPQWKNV